MNKQRLEYIIKKYGGYISLIILVGISAIHSNQIKTEYNTYIFWTLLALQLYLVFSIIKYSKPSSKIIDSFIDAFVKNIIKTTLTKLAKERDIKSLKWVQVNIANFPERHRKYAQDYTKWLKQTIKPNNDVSKCKKTPKS